MTPDDALAVLRGAAEPTQAESKAAYHKQTRPVLGVPNPVINDLTKAWRQSLSVEQRIALADGLWTTDIFEARIAASKVLTQARIRPDDAVWELIVGWVPDFDSWAIADHACAAGQKRLVAAPGRLDLVEGWITSPHMWTRRSAMVISLPWAKLNNPKPADVERREQILEWAAKLVPDRDWFIQKCIAWWVRDLSKRAPDRARMFLSEYGDAMKPFARREAGKYLSK
ncbi:MAG: DNA alkylation repair protein [Pseudomonadota bacterium]